MTWATERLDALKAGETTVPPVVTTLKMGTLDDWGPGWVRIHFSYHLCSLRHHGRHGLAQ